MSEDHRLAYHKGPDTAVLVVMHVGTADADGGDFDEDFAHAGLGNRTVLHAHVPGTVEHRSPILSMQRGCHSPVTAPSVSPVTSHLRTISPTRIIGATTIVPMAVSCPQSIEVCVTSWEAAIGSV